MGLARVARCACAVLLAVLGTPAAARASGTLVLHPDGRVSVRHERLPSLPPPPPGAVAAPRARAAAGPSVGGALDRLVAAGAITPAERRARARAYRDARRTLGRLTGARRLALGGMLTDLRGIAARGQLTASRIPPLWLTLERNLQWWRTGPLLGSGRRVGFSGSQLVWQYYAGHGIQIQWLGTFGKLNALVKSRKDVDAALGRFVDEVLPLASERAGGLAWEYLFAFNGMAAPWVSGLAQGTGLQALSRAAVRLGREADVLPVAQRGLALFQAPPPAGVRTPADGGVHYLQYSGLPSLRILNGFIQSLVGLHDYAELARDPLAAQLFADGDAAARAEVPAYDTGAWSLYSRGTVTRESDLSYHVLLRDFLQNLCDRTAEPVHCTAAAHFTAYLRTPPVLRVLPATLRATRWGVLKVRVSKISRVTLRVTRRGRTVLLRSGGTLGRGTRTFGFIPAHHSTYRVTFTATDLAGNTASATRTVEVARRPGRR
jgi:D-glucuronyl C5-epimerase-like protein